MKWKDIKYVGLRVLGEFFLLLDAAFVGYSMGGGYLPTQREILAFWAILILAVLFRYWAESLKNPK